MERGGPLTILITGGAGALGQKAARRLARIEGARLRLVDRRPAGGDPPVLAADLAGDPDGWAHHLDGVDVVLHLAGEPSPTAPWRDVLRDNVDATNDVLLVAARKGVRRVILASSNWVLAGHRFRRTALDAGAEPAPVNPYGVSKLANERMGRAVARHFGLSVIALRIGYCLREDNRPGPHLRFGRWGQQMWLSDEDWAEAAARAVLCDAAGFAVVNAVSRNRGMRWDLGQAREATGYVPRSGHAPATSLFQRAREAAARLRHRRLLRWQGRFPGWDW